MKIRFIPYLLLISIIFSCSLTAQPRFWEPTNGPFGGNVTALGASTDFVFAVIENSLYRSRIDQADWQNVTPESLEIYRFSERKFLSNAEDDVYFLTGSQLWRSRDNGLSWDLLEVPQTDGSGSVIINDFSLSPEGHIYVTSGWGIAISEDDGVSWEYLQYSFKKNEFNTIYVTSQGEIIVTQPPTFDERGKVGERIYRSSDGGMNWEATLVRYQDLGYFPDINVEGFYTKEIIELDDGTLFYSFVVRAGEDFRDPFDNFLIRLDDLCSGDPDDLDSDNDGISDGCDNCPELGSIGLDFDGQDDNLLFTLDALEESNPVHTIETWVYLDELPTSRSWLFNFGPFSTGSHHWLIRPNGTLQIGVFSGGGEQFTPQISTGRWIHMASVHDGSNLTFYIDGAEIGTLSASFNLADKNFHIGRPVNDEAYFKGKIDEVRIWNVARSPEEILNNMNQELGGSEEGLVAYFNFAEGLPEENNECAAFLVDKTGNFEIPLNNFAKTGSASNWVSGAPVSLLPSGNHEGNACLVRRGTGLVGTDEFIINVSPDKETLELPDLPPGTGTYSGAFVSGNTFNVQEAGIGAFELVYTVTDPSSGCSGSQVVLVRVSGAGGGDGFQVLQLPPRSMDTDLELATRGNELLLSNQDGLYRSVDHGASWSRINFSAFTTNVTALAVNPEGTLFTGQSRYGIYRNNKDESSHEGFTNGLTNPKVISTLFLGSDKRLFAGASELTFDCDFSASLYALSEEGGSWENQDLFLLLDPANDFCELEVKVMAERADGTTYIGTNFGLIKGQKGLDSWSLRNPNSLYDIDDLHIDANGTLIALMRGNVRYSVDEGETWPFLNNTGKIRGITLSPEGYILMVEEDKLSYIDEYTINEDGLLTSISFVEALNDKLDLDNDPLQKVITDSHGLIVTVTENGKLYQSYDLGNHWFLLTSLPEPSTVTDLLESPSGLLYLSTSDGVYEFNDLNGRWQPIKEGLPGGVNELELDEKNYLYAATNRGVYRSKVPVSSRAVASNVFEEVFSSNSFGDWTTEVVKGEVNWEWTDSGPSGVHADSTGSIQSESMANGWAIFDSDQLNNYPEGQEAWLISPKIENRFTFDISTEIQKAVLSFQTLYLSWYDRPAVRIGTDLADKENWASIEIFPGIEAGQFGGALLAKPGLNPQTIELDITEYLDNNQEHFYLAFVFQSDETTINGPTQPNYQWPHYGTSYRSKDILDSLANNFGWGFNWQIDDVAVWAYRSAANAFITAAPPPNRGVPANQLSAFGLGARVGNLGYVNYPPGSTTKVTIEEESSEGNKQVFEGERQEGYIPVFEDIIIIIGETPVYEAYYPIDTNQVFFTPDSEVAPGTRYTINYKLDPMPYQDLDTVNNVVSYQMTVTDTLFQKENGAEGGYSYEAFDSPNPDYSVANIFYVPNDKNQFGQQLFARHLSFGVTNAHELAGKKVVTALFKWDGDSGYGEGIIDPEEYGDFPVATNSYTFTGEEGTGLITIPVSSGGFIPLEGGYHYVVMVKYETEDEQRMLFQVSNSIDYYLMAGLNWGLGQPRYYSAVDFGNTGRLSLMRYLNVWNDDYSELLFTDPIPVIRLSVGPAVISSSREEELLEGSVQLYPNPVTDKLWMDIDLDRKAEWVNLRILNSRGQVLSHQNLGSLQKARLGVSVDQLPTGVYMVEIRSNLGRTTRKVMVK